MDVSVEGVKVSLRRKPKKVSFIIKRFDWSFFISQAVSQSADSKTRCQLDEILTKAHFFVA